MKCQKCRQPVKLHGSLEELSSAAVNLLIGSSANSSQLLAEQLPSNRPPYPAERREVYDKSAQNASAPVFKRVVPATRYGSPTPRAGTPGNHSRSHSSPLHKSVYQNPAESFVMLTQSQLTPTPPTSRSNSGIPPEFANAESDPNMMSSDMKAKSKLFDILTSRSDIDHPICMECTEMLVEGLKKRLSNSVRERDSFVDFLKKVNAEVPTDSEREEAEEDLRQLLAEEEAAFKELQETEKEKAGIEAEIKALEEEARKLDEEEEAFWRDNNKSKQRLDEFQNERDSVNLQYDHDSRQLEKLQRTNVYNDTFCIGHDGYFGTINGLRLGRLPNQPVEWSEINAAWGQTLLLLATIAEKLSFTFDSYKLKPMGSTSRIEKIEISSSNGSVKTTILELFSSGDLPIGRMFMHRKFDQAMVAFLECLRQLGEFVERTDPDMKLPYRILKDRIGDSCIRLAFNQDETWTKACKYTLTCVKFLLAHTSNVAYARRASTTQ
ncbi:Vacuolar protein sorting-associated protein atg6 [Rhizina undulata]